MSQIRVGVPQFISSRPLVYGLMRNLNPPDSLAYNEPAALAEALERDTVDVALIPSIEYLRGTGRYFVDGPSLVAKPVPGSVLLVSKTPIDAIERVAVSEFCRSPIAVLRIVLAEVYQVMPDLHVAKNLVDWRDTHDAVLLSGDDALRYIAAPADADVTLCDVTSEWYELTSKPLVSAMWVYNDSELSTQLGKSLITSRNLGLQNLSRLADGISQTSQFESEFLYNYLSNNWSYQFDDTALEGLRALEEYALHYDLIRESRLGHITTG